MADRMLTTATWGAAVGPDDGQAPQAEELVYVLGGALHAAGLPAHRLEEMLNRVAMRYGIQVHVFSLPTGLLYSFVRQGPPVTALLRLAPSPTNLEKLRRLTAEAEALARSGGDPAAAIARVGALAATPPRWGRGATVLGFALSSAAFSVFFGGGRYELGVAAAVGTVVGLIAFLFGPRRGASRRFELIAAAFAGLIAGAADSYWVPLASGLIALLPGLALVDAIEELANGHPTSGSARMAGVGVAFLTLIFGVLLGVALDDVLLGDGPEQPMAAFPWWATIPALGVAAAGSVIRFQARPRDWWLFLIASAVAFGGSKLGALLGNPLLGPFVGALLLAGMASLYAQLRGSAPQMVLVPGLVMLVPGSFGLRSMNTMLSGDAVVGIEEGFQMLMTTMAIVAGLLAGSSLRLPRFEHGRVAG